ncbi:MAG: phospholipid-binding protein MlaC [Pseudomonadales bacterium]|jgi:phospholipid transport system substrate-binding protein
MKLIWALLLGLSLSAPVLAEVPDPKQAVQTATDELLGKLEEVRPLYAEDPDQFFAAIDEALSPFIDFEGFSRGVMAKYYRRATDEQKAEFSETFRTALIRTYGKALIEFDNQKIVVLEPSLDPKRPNRATIALEIHGANNAIYPVEYSLTLEDNRWLLRNVSIEGINIGLQFRSQFASFMSQYRNDIDQVIENWTVDASS